MSTDLSVAHPTLLAVEEISKTFQKRVALNRLSFSLSGGEVVGLLGANGSGKTTSLRILSGLLKPDSGRVSIMGCDLSHGTRSTRRWVGYLSQRLSLYGALSVRENLMYRAEAYGLPDPCSAIDASVERFGLKSYEHHRINSLSIGWARTAQLAATLVHMPPLILLDEPTTGLDPVARQAVWRQIMRLATEGRAVLISTHDIADACRCSRIVLLSRGGVVATGAPSDFPAAATSRVLLASGPTLRWAERIQQLSGVLTTYPNGGRLRILVNPSALNFVMDSISIQGLKVEQVEPTLEDALLELTRHDREAALV